MGTFASESDTELDLIDGNLMRRLDGLLIRPSGFPRATYRLQLHKEFTFRDAERLVPYLAALGISHLYASPIFRANPGSMHGYDVVDYSELNPEIGTDREFEALSDALTRNGMGLLLDFVPNHMGIASGRNRWWQDLLENGQSSEYADFFDIDWQPIKPELENQVLLPFLGDHYGVVLENGELELRYDQGVFTIWYYDLPLPIAPPTYPLILLRALQPLLELFDQDNLELLEFQSIAAAFGRLAAQHETDPDLVSERAREQRLTKIRLANLVDGNQTINGALARTLEEINGTVGVPRSFDLLDELISHQSYRLSFWRVAAEEINYRRFFAINELAAIRQEHVPVFEATHELLVRLIGEGRVDAVRIDHPDGLWDPAAYFRDVQRAAFIARARSIWESQGDSEKCSVADLEEFFSTRWQNRLAGEPTEPKPRAIALYIEKILEPGESLPSSWLVDGTVGYEFAQSVNGLFVDSSSRGAFDELYNRFTGGAPRFQDLVYEKKKLILRVALASELNVLARALDRLSEHHRRTRDFTFNGLRFAMREVIACFPVYRTYVEGDSGTVSSSDRAYIERAIREAIKRNPASDQDVFNFLHDVLLLKLSDEINDAQRAEHLHFVKKFQQLTGPVMAKGLEDTAFYSFFRLTSLNEVGGDPSAFGVMADDFHKRNSARLQRWPHAMLTSSTHDTKRSEDVRARINVLSELPKTWRQSVNRWARVNRKYKSRVDGEPSPDRNDEYLFYQTIIGAWPLDLDHPDADFIDRIDAYLLKVIHEAQVHTSWINPNEGYDNATSEFVRRVLSPENSRFLADFAKMNQRVSVIGAFNALSQHFLKLTAPGVPDIYQGTELWDFSLVDPDNRRPVDFDRRVKELARLKHHKPTRKLARSLVNQWADGRIKLFLTQRVLTLRQSDPELFTGGDYVPLAATGAKADHVVAFARERGDRQLIAVAPRLVSGLVDHQLVSPLGQIWLDTGLLLQRAELGDRYRCMFTGAEHTVGRSHVLPLADILDSFPVALLERTELGQSNAETDQRA